MSLRIAYIVPTLDQSGAEKQLSLLATHLGDGFTPHVFALTRGGPYEKMLEAAGIPLTVIGKRWKLDPRALRRLTAALKQFQPDILHTWLFAANAYGRMAAKALPNARVIVSERCVDRWKAGWQLRVDRWLLPRTDLLVGNSQSVADFYEQQGVPREKLVTIPNGIDIPPTNALPSAAERATWREQLGFSPESFVVGHVGRLATQKRVRDILWAVETVRQIRPSLKLVIAGDGPERQSLEQFAYDTHLMDHVRFLGHRSDASAISSQLDAFVLASSFEGMSNSLMEAMAWGCPVVASDISPNREMVTHEQTGLLYPVGDTIALMQALRRYLDEPELRDRCARAAREYASQSWSISSMVKAWEQMYQKISQSSHSPS